MTQPAQSVFNLISEKELVDLAVAMGNITAPSGYEQPMADFVLGWLKENGFEDHSSSPFVMVAQMPSASSMVRVEGEI